VTEESLHLGWVPPINHKQSGCGRMTQVMRVCIDINQLGLYHGRALVELLMKSEPYHDEEPAEDELAPSLGGTMPGGTMPGGETRCSTMWR
jgi:hypothetical protein